MKKKWTARSRITLPELVLAGLALVSLVVLLSYAFSYDGNGRDFPTAAVSNATVHEITRHVAASQAPTSSASELPAATRPQRVLAQTTVEMRKDLPPADNSSASPIAANGGALQEADTIGTGVSDPVVLTDPLPDQLLAEQQVNQIALMREQFVELLGGTDQDATQPQYLKRWEQAQTLLDDEFRSFFGEEMFNQQQLLSVAASNP